MQSGPIDAKKTRAEPGLILNLNRIFAMLFGSAPFYWLCVGAKLRFVATLQGRSSRGLNLLLVAVGGVTATDNNQRHHQNANNAEQLLHRNLLIEHLKVYS